MWGLLVGLAMIPVALVWGGFLGDPGAGRVISDGHPSEGRAENK
jgi:hypothetical protein